MASTPSQDRPPEGGQDPQAGDEAEAEDDFLQAKNWKQKIHLLIEDPDSSIAARILSHCVLYTIVMAIAGFVLQTQPDLAKSPVLEGIELGSTLVFTIEYIVRFLVCDAFHDQTKLGFVRAPMNVLDILAILPYYVERPLESLGSMKCLRALRCARLIRIFRVFKLSKYSLGMSLMVESLVKSVQPLSILAFFLLVGVVLFSALLFYAERLYCPDVPQARLITYQKECFESENGRSLNGDLCCNEHGSSMGFESIAITAWWSIVTMTTVGYGDMVPRTGLGRIIGAMAMLSGIVLISLPVASTQSRESAIVGAKFQKAYEDFEQDKHDLLAMDDEEGVEHTASKGSKGSKGFQTLNKVRVVISAQERIKSTLGKNTPEPGELPQSRERPQSQGSADLSGTQKPRARQEAATPRAAQVAPAPEAADARWPPACEGVPTPPASPTGGHADARGATWQGERSQVSDIKAKLKKLETRMLVSASAQESIQLLLELLEHVDRADKQLFGLREKDRALDVVLRRDFAAFSRSCEQAMQAEAARS